MRVAKYFETLVALELLLAFFPIVIFWCFGVVYSIFIPFTNIEVGFYWIYIPTILGGLGIWGLFRAYASVFFSEKRTTNKKVTFLLLGCGLATLVILIYMLGVGSSYVFFILVLPILATLHLSYLLKNVYHGNS